MRDACLSTLLGTWLVLVASTLVVAKDIPIFSNYVIKRQDSCPDVGYYFRREPSTNAVDPGQCLLCFCREPGLAACWVRESMRCDVENYTLTSSSESLSRSRRSALGLGDIFFRDAARDFFNKQLPVQCKANQESFSDGCPPADWCIGCTVCDCDANGRWDCHILSFCNEEERKKKMGDRKNPGKDAKKSTKKIGKQTKKNNKQKPKNTKKPNQNIKPTKQTKSDKPTKSTKVNKLGGPTSKPNKKVVKRVIKKVNDTLKLKENQKQPPRRIIIKKRANNKTIKQKRESQKQIYSKKLMNKEISNHNTTQMANRGKISLSDKLEPNTEFQMGQMLVKRVMSSVQQMVKSELDRINKTAIERGLNIDCEDNVEKKKKKKKETSKQFKYKKIGQEFRWMRSKRNVAPGNESTTSIYDNGIGSTTDLDTGPSIEADKDIKSINVIGYLITTPKNIQISQAINNHENVDNKTRLFNNSAIQNSINDTTLKFQIIVNDDINTTNQRTGNINSIIKKVPDFNERYLDKWPIMNNYKYNLDHEQIDNSIQFIATFKPNSVEKEGKYSIQNNATTKSPSLKHNLIPRIIKKGYRNLSGIYFPSKDIKAGNNSNLIIRESVFNNKRGTKNKFNLLKYIKKILNKLIYFGKRSNHLQGKEDEYQMIKILCDNKKYCKINKRNRKILKNKIRKLNVEIKTIFKSIKIIKGLLRLIDIPDLSNNMTSFKNDIKKLNAILKGNVLEGTNLTETQKTQINYLKTNTKTFANSVSKFTSLVNDVTNILQRNKHEVIRTTRYANKNLTESFDKIKKILIKHNLIENTFIKKIYTMLTDLELKVSNKTKVSDKRINNYVINKYSRDIIDNLRKLRGLAQTLNSSRRKRQVSSTEDNMDYLLVLLEYLLKQDQNVGTDPAHDGIDVLIETIKNAPDIKDIRKKVLESYPQVQPVLRTATNFKTSATSDENETKYVESDQISDSNSISKEINNSSILNDMLSQLKGESGDDEGSEILKGGDEEASQNKGGSPYRDASENARGVSDDGSSNYEGANHFNRIPYNDRSLEAKDTTDERDTAHNIKRVPYQDVPQDKDTYDDVTLKANPYDDATQGLRVIPYEDISQNVYYEKVDGNLTNYESIEKVTEPSSKPSSKEKLGFDKFENTINIDKKLESYSEDDDNPTVNNSMRGTTGKTLVKESNEKNNHTIKYVDSYQSSDNLGNLEWIEENFGKELKEFSEKELVIIESTPTTTTAKLVPTPTTSTTRTPNLSVVSNEVSKKEKKLSAEEVMYKKQMDLLNSLDYGTERADFEDTKSEDDMTDSLFN